MQTNEDLGKLPTVSPVLTGDDRDDDLSDTIIKAKGEHLTMEAGDGRSSWSPPLTVVVDGGRFT